MIGFVAGFCAWEYRDMVGSAGKGVDVAFIPLCVFVAVSGALGRIDWFSASAFLGMLILIAKPAKGGLIEKMTGLAGVLYIGVLLGLLGFLRAQPGGQEWCFVVLFVTWSNDTGAYLGGRAFGRRKMAPAISPSKSWEGAAFGLVAGLTAGLCFGKWVGLSPFAGALSGAFLGVLAQIGDLFESWLKRSCSVKDSGKAIPGHGGFLDRFDSLMFTGAGGLLLREIYLLFLQY